MRSNPIAQSLQRSASESGLPAGLRKIISASGICPVTIQQRRTMTSLPSASRLGNSFVASSKTVSGRESNAPTGNSETSLIVIFHRTHTCLATTFKRILTIFKGASRASLEPILAHLGCQLGNVAKRAEIRSQAASSSSGGDAEHTPSKMT
jgi:hypothetical protein